MVDANGNITEQWTQWDSLFRRPHAVYINPYDPDKYVWVVDDHNQALFKFTHDGKQLVQTIGTKGEAGEDDKHFNRPTYLAWLPDGTMFVSDGYNGHRVVKFDKNGKYLMAWGEKGNSSERDAARLFQRGTRHRSRSRLEPHLCKRPGQPPHAGVRRERKIHRAVAVRESVIGERLYIGADRKIWAFDDTTSQSRAV